MAACPPAPPGPDCRCQRKPLRRGLLRYTARPEKGRFSAAGAGSATAILSRADGVGGRPGGEGVAEGQGHWKPAARWGGARLGVSAGWRGAGHRSGSDSSGARRVSCWPQGCGFFDAWSGRSACVSVPALGS